jgi:DNA-binding transcriptional MerR regulator
MNKGTTGYTLEELGQEVARRIRDAGLAQPNRQVSDVPDARTLRYYTTLGLMDRPTEIRDRRAHYRDRHVDQVTAVKRLQSAGCSLTEIQSLLLGLSPADLHEVAEGRRPRARRAREEPFWSRPPAPATTQSLSTSDHTEAKGAGERVPDQGSIPATVTGIPLAGSLTLLFATPARPPSADDLEALDAAARPLVDELIQRGLLDTPKESRP